MKVCNTYLLCISLFLDIPYCLRQIVTFSHNAFLVAPTQIVFTKRTFSIYIATQKRVSTYSKLMLILLIDSILINPVYRVMQIETTDYSEISSTVSSISIKFDTHAYFLH